MPDTEMFRRGRETRRAMPGTADVDGGTTGDEISEVLRHATVHGGIAAGLDACEAVLTAEGALPAGEPVA